MNNMLRPITNESDLDFYRSNLEMMNFDTGRMNPAEESRQKELFWNHLTNHKGKLVKVEIKVGNCSKSKVGILLDVGADFIDLKINGAPISIVIPVSSVHSVTVVHDNDRRKIRSY